MPPWHWRGPSAGGNRCTSRSKTVRRFTVPAITPPERSLPVHPTQIYSVIDGLVLCLLLLGYGRFRRRDGEVSALLMTIYPISRFFIETLRSDEAPIFGTGMSISQNVSLLLLVCAGGVVVLRASPAARHRLAKMRDKRRVAGELVRVASCRIVLNRLQPCSFGFDNEPSWPAAIILPSAAGPARQIRGNQTSRRSSNACLKRRAASAENFARVDKTAAERLIRQRVCCCQGVGQPAVLSPRRTSA